MPSHKFEDAQIPDGNCGEKTIPKFASFRPKGASSSHANKTRKPFDDDQRRADSSKSSAVDGPRHHKHSSSIPRSQAHHEDRAQKERTNRSHQSFARKADEQDEEVLQSYVVDRVGDPNNLTFGTLHRHATPPYFRFGAGNILGSLTGQKIDRSASSEKGLVLSYTKRGGLRRGDRRAFWRAAQPRAKELKIRPQSSDLLAGDLEADFVSLRSSQRVKRRRRNTDDDVQSSSNSEDEDTHYRSVNGKAKPQNCPEDKDLAYASDASPSSGDENNGTSTMESSVSRKRAELSRVVDADSGNADAWLDLIRHQDDVTRSHIEPKRTSLTTAERRSTAEIKLSMYEKALNNVKDPDARQRLLIGKMGDAVRIWDNQKLFSEWQSILLESPGSLALWKEYLNFKQTAFASFRYDDVHATYNNCLSLLRRTRMTSGASDAEMDKLYKVQMYILLRLTLFMRESGFAEQAVAVWQALLEYGFFRPPDLRDPEHREGGSNHVTTMLKFEEFWDSEVPRIGEDGREGWVAFAKARGEPPEPKTGIRNQLHGDQNPWGSWVHSERTQSLQARMPARTIDESIEDDPYRVILFSDIQLFLSDSPSDPSRAACINAFLRFCHLPSYQEESHEGETIFWWREGYLHNEFLTSSNVVLQFFMAYSSGEETLASGHPEAFNHEPTPSFVRRSLFDMPMADYQLSSDSMFAVRGSWFSSFDAWCNNCHEHGGPLEKTWVLRILKQLVATGAGGDSLAEYLLALELRLSPKTVKKTARGLLKKRPSSLQLYNAYALIEYGLGNASAGENVLFTSIKMGKTLDEAAQQNSILLWRAWAWELLNTGDIHKALELMLSYGQDDVLSRPPSGHLSDSQSPPSALLLRAERALTATCDHLLSLGQHKLAAIAIDCLILFTYFKSASSLSAATSVFKSNCTHLTTYTSSITSAHELLHQTFARLLYHHVTHTHLVKPSDIRSLLTESITLFPQNTIFLSLYAWNEARFRIDDRVRSIVKDVVLAENIEDSRGKRQESVIPHFFAIYSELNRAVTFGSNVSTIRSTFERAVRSESGAHCAGLWKLYFVFEHSRGDMGKAKGIFWRAVRACPWAKELYMLAFDYLRGAGGFTDEDLRGVYELMGEKELRIHVNLEEVFDAMDEGKAIRKAQGRMIIG